MSSLAVRLDRRFVTVNLKKNKLRRLITLLEDLETDNARFLDAVLRVFTRSVTKRVQMFGPNVAVVTGRAREVGTGKDGKTFDRAFLFTDTWMMRAGKWQCIASQVNKIKG